MGKKILVDGRAEQQSLWNTGHDLEAGYNEIHIYGVEAGLALQKLVLYRGGLEESYLGPQESPRA